MMIVGCSKPRTIGERHLGCVIQNSGDRFGVELPYVVLREATEQEWIDEQIADGCWGPTEQLRFRLGVKCERYYEVSVD